VIEVIWAIWKDTWRQSRQQIVYLLLAFVLLAISIGSVFLVTVRPNLQGQPMLTFRMAEQSVSGLEVIWNQQYRQAMAGERIEAALRAPDEELRRARSDLKNLQRELGRAQRAGNSATDRATIEQQWNQLQERVQKATAERSRIEKEVGAEAQKLVDVRAPAVSPLVKGVEVWTSKITSLLFWIIMFGFISAGAGYFPGMMKAGAIDLIVSKPIGRFQIFMGKYLGGLGLCSAALLGSEIILLVGLGISSGVWHWGLLAAFPLTLFSAALLFAVVMGIGVVTRSTALSMLGGYAYYLVVDTLLLAIQSIGALGLHIKWLEDIGVFVRWTFPIFSRLRNAAAASVLHIPIFEWHPVLIAGVWLLALLAISYTFFRRIDF
jgi:ABC-type transport system involved in multi-copper enzyme maturation permease subunit/Skp family chaperone for outer membrane proteins